MCLSVCGHTISFHWYEFPHRPIISLLTMNEAVRDITAGAIGGKETQKRLSLT